MDIFIFFYLFIFLFIFSFKNCNCQDDDSYMSYCFHNDYGVNEYCFNKILIFKNKDYHLNNFAKNKNGDILAEFTKYANNDELSSSRMFYGLKNNGQNLFYNKSSNTLEFNISNDEKTSNENIGLIKSKNLFVTIKNTDNIEVQYLFAINADNSIVEFYDLNNYNNVYYIWKLNEFFQIKESESLWPCNYELFEMKQESEYVYIIAFIPNEKIEQDILSSTFIKIFEFRSFDADAFGEIKSINFETFENKEILSVFLMDDDNKNTFVVLTYDNNRRRRNSKLIQNHEPSSLRKINSEVLNLRFYSISFNVITDKDINFYYLDYYYEQNLFIKSLYLNNHLTLFIYFSDYFEDLFVGLFELNYNEPTNPISSLIYRNFDIYNLFFHEDESLNDLVRINDNRAVFIYMCYYYNNHWHEWRFLELLENKRLCIYLLDIDKISRNIKIYEHIIYFENFLIYQISGFSYNDYFLQLF